MKIITHVANSGSGMAAIYDDIADSPRFVIKGKLRHVGNDPKRAADMRSGCVVNGHSTDKREKYSPAMGA